MWPPHQEGGPSLTGRSKWVESPVTPSLVHSHLSMGLRTGEPVNHPNVFGPNRAVHDQSFFKGEPPVAALHLGRCRVGDSVGSAAAGGSRDSVAGRDELIASDLATKGTRLMPGDAIAICPTRPPGVCERRKTATADRVRA